MARVLVVEDDADIRELVALRLRGGGHQTVTVPDADADAALALVAAKGAPEVAVLDVGLPGMDGMTLLAEMRTRADLPELPAIFLTARVNDNDVARGRAMGATYLTKPFIASALLSAVERLTAPLSGPAGW